MNYSIRDLYVEALRSSLTAMTTANGYNYQFSTNVWRAKTELTTQTAVSIFDGVGQFTFQHRVAVQSFPVVIEAHVGYDYALAQHPGLDRSRLVNGILADLQKGVFSLFYPSNKNLVTLISQVEPIFDGQHSDYLSASMTLQFTVKTPLNDPYTEVP